MDNTVVNNFWPNDEEIFNRYSKGLFGFCLIYHVEDRLLNQCFNKLGFHSLFKIIKLLNWYERFGVTIEERKAKSINWAEGLEIIISEYGKQRHGNYHAIGYNAVCSGDDTSMLHQDFFEQILEGAAFAYWLPKLRDELWTLRNPLQNKGALISQGGEVVMKSTSTPIRWKRKPSLLAYLFYRMQELQLIQGEHIAANLASVFVDKDYKPIDNKTLNKYFSDLRNSNKLTQGSVQIDELVALLKEIDQKL